ncbi:MAG TPA: Na+/H+ antiporter NhaC family protein [Candidatus Anaerotruncus excrementipullorum]|uniref:Na+/H+ antiporter NhaC family protein n=1 Tax=Candidatus Anaerotruncus excrementipullorum TaxID=2838465 RepID=A0A9D1WPP6_9FIRM|nr:Na+/H+ antiporter NhaC family protein [Candidatus Anaerotruncus excrementipullorum]
MTQKNAVRSATCGGTDVKGGNMENKLSSPKGSGKALIPLFVFLGLYVVSGLYNMAQGVPMPFYEFPSPIALGVGIVVAFFMTKGSITEKFDIFCGGMARPTLLLMIIIFLLAGAFASICTATGARDSVVNFGLSLVPAKYMIPGIFVVSCFFGTATGTAAGTVSALVPIAASIADAAGLSIPLAVGSVIAGGQFGDNLSMISDTTIAATRSQHCGMKDKFHMNFLVSLPAAVITIVLLMVFAQPETVTAVEVGDYSIIKILPYFVVMILALLGMDVLITLMIGVAMTSVIGIVMNSMSIFELAQAAYTGFTDMTQSVYICLLIGGLSAMVTHNGGIEWLIAKLRTFIKGRKSAEMGIAVMVMATDICLANNTVAIIVSGPIARDISEEFKVDPRKSAALLDIFACIWQGVLPYMGSLTIAVNLTAAALPDYVLDPAELFGCVWYVWILAIFGILNIFFPYADGRARKNPWNWEYDCPESEVEKKKQELAAEAANQ